MIPLLSFSPLTVFEIRFGKCRDGETRERRIQRLCETYALHATHVRLMIGVDDEHIDVRGRMAP